MAKQLVKGEKIVLNKIENIFNNITLNITCESTLQKSYDIDTFLFMFEESSRIHKKGIVFYNNPESICKSIQFREYNDETIKKITFEVNLNGIPKNITKLILGGSVFKNKSNPSSDSNSASLNISLAAVNRITQTEIFSLDVKCDIASNDAFILGEVYKHTTFWKFNAIDYSLSSDLLGSVKTVYNAGFY